jgi:hypothetical protein
VPVFDLTHGLLVVQRVDVSSTVAVLRPRPTTACVKVQSALLGCSGGLPPEQA